MINIGIGSGLVRRALENRAQFKPATGIPPELNRHIPRAVQLSGAGYFVSILIPLLVCGAVVSGVLLYSNASRGMARHKRILEQGIRGQGEIVESFTRRGENRRRVIVYSYGAGAESFRKQTTLRSSDRRPAQAGLKVPIRYLPEKPGESWLEGYEPNGPPMWAAAGAPFGLLVFVLIISRSIACQRRMLTEGRAALAHVIKSKRKGSSHGTHYDIEFEFQSMEGATRRLKLNLSKTLPEGGSVVLLYNKDNPKRGALYPLSLVKLSSPG